jgi:hypothetical protein
MALQLAPGPGSERGEGSVYGGSQRGGRPGTGHSTGRAASFYGGGSSGGPGLHYSSSQASNRARSKSLADPIQYNKDGRMILHYCEFLPLRC